MEIDKVLNDTKKSDIEKVTLISEYIIQKHMDIKDVENLYHRNDFIILIEAVELISRKYPECTTEDYIIFSGKYISSKIEKIQWLAIRIIHHLALLYPNQVEPLIKDLLNNTTSTSTVVRWAIADAFVSILKIPTYQDGSLYGKLMIVYHHEKQQSVRRTYEKALQLDENRKYNKKREVVYR